MNSPVRACKSVRRDPLFIAKAAGSKIYDADGREYIDFVASWGPMILGHAHEAVVRAVREAAEEGTSFGAPTEKEVEMAELIVGIVPSIEKVRMVNSGTEATMSALRLARGVTERDLVVKFDGCYHGHAGQFPGESGVRFGHFGDSRQSREYPRTSPRTTFPCRTTIFRLSGNLWTAPGTVWPR